MATPGDTSGQGAPSEEELRARLEEEMRRIRVDDVLVQTVVTLVNLGGQRLGLTESTRENRDLDQARVAIEAVRTLLPLLEQSEGGAEMLRPVRDALAQLQMAYAREAGTGAPPPGGEAPPGEGPGGGEPPPGQAPRQRPSGGLWVPPGSK